MIWYVYVIELKCQYEELINNGNLLVNQNFIIFISEYIKKEDKLTDNENNFVFVGSLDTYFNGTDIRNTES